MDLIYKSTRNNQETATASEAILKGLAGEGGLFVPSYIPKLDKSLEELSKMSYQEVNEHIEYYENYFDTELAHGKSEREILEKLGDPRLIAKTILQTSGDGTEHGDGETENGRKSGRRWRRSENGRVFHIPGWLFFTVFAVIFFLILWLVG